MAVRIEEGEELRTEEGTAALGVEHRSTGAGQAAGGRGLRRAGAALRRPEEALAAGAWGEGGAGARRWSRGAGAAPASGLRVSREERRRWTLGGAAAERRRWGGRPRRGGGLESGDRKSTRLNSSHNVASRMPSSA